MAHLTTFDELNQHISMLTSVEETTAPVTGACFNLEEGLSDGRIPRLIAHGSPPVNYYAAFAGGAVASQEGVGP